MLRAYLLVYPFLALYLLVGALIGVPWTWASGDIRFLYWIARQGVRLAYRLAGVEVRLVHPEYAFERPTNVYVCNHVSNLEPPALFMVLPRIVVILKKELSRVPILGYVMGLGDFIYVDRSAPDSRHQALRQAVERLRRGISLLIFPEGTRSRDGRLLPFRPGPFTMAIEAQTPIVPITAHGARELMPKGSLAIRPGRITLVFHPPIDTAGMTVEDRATLMQRVRSIMAADLEAGPP